jgi:type VI secretion system Hcp family effector
MTRPSLPHVRIKGNLKPGTQEALADLSPGQLVGRRRHVIECHGFNYDALAGISPAGGQPNGRRQHVIACHGFNYDALADVSPGHSSGSRLHQPCTIRKDADSSSPVLWQARTNGMTIDTVHVDVVGQNRTGRQPVGLTLILGGVIVTKFIKRVGPAPRRPPGQGTAMQESEEVELTYQTIGISGHPNSKHNG